MFPEEGPSLLSMTLITLLVYAVSGDQFISHSSMRVVTVLAPDLPFLYWMMGLLVYLRP